MYYIQNRQHNMLPLCNVKTTQTISEEITKLACYVFFKVQKLLVLIAAMFHKIFVTTMYNCTHRELELFSSSSITKVTIKVLRI